MIKSLERYKFWLLTAIILLAIILGSYLPSININTDFSQFLPDDDPEYTFYNELKSQIKSDESIIIIGIKNNKTIYDKQFIEQVQSFVQSLDTIKGIETINSITNLSYPIKSLFGLINVPYLSVNDTININSYRSKITKDAYLTQNFVDSKETSLFIWLTLNQIDNIKHIENTLQSIEKVRSSYSNLITHQWGKMFIQKELNEITKNETKKIFLWAILFMILALSFIYKSKKAVLYSLILVVTSLIIFIGGLAALGVPFNLMSNLFPTIILIVGISDIIHLSIKFNYESKKDISQSMAFNNTLREIGWAIFITSVTTAIGFLILQTSSMKVLRDFGLEAGIAVILTFIIILILSPLLFLNHRFSSNFSLGTLFSKTFNLIYKKVLFLQKFPKFIFGFFIAFTIIGLWGIFSINTNNLQFSIPENSKLKNDYRFFEEHLGGSRTFELIITSKNNHKLNEPNIIEQIHLFQNYLDSLPYLNNLKSPILYYRLLHKTYNPSWDYSDSLHLDNNKLNSYERHIDKIASTAYLMNKEKTLFKISSQMKDVGRHNIATRNNMILSKANKILDTTLMNIRVTGMDYLFDRSHDKRITNMIYGIILAIILVSIILGLLFKNLKIILLALILNIIPIIISAGLLGFTALELRAGSTIIFTIAFVLVVDDTIHFLSKFRWNLKQGNSIEDSISITLRQCGKAIFASSIILLAGFSVLMFSNYNEIFMLGLFMSIIIIIKLSIDLILAPMLILKVFKNPL